MDERGLGVQLRGILRYSLSKANRSALKAAISKRPSLYACISGSNKCSLQLLHVDSANIQQRAKAMHNSSPSLSLGQEGEVIDNASLSTHLQPGPHTRLPANFLSRQSLPSKALEKASLSVAAFFLIAVAFTAFCTRLRSRVSEAGVRPRRLAEGGGGEEAKDDDELEAILEACLDYEQEHYPFTPGLPPRTGPSSSSTPQIGSPQGTEPLEALWPSSAPQWRALIPAPPYDVPPAGSLQPCPSKEGLGPQLPPAEGDTSPGGREGPPYPQLEAGAWMDQIPQLEPQAWLDQMPDIISSGAIKSPAGPDGQGSLEDDAQPSTSAASQAELPPESTEVSRLAQHPFVQLPRLQAGVSTRAINVYRPGAGPFKVKGNSTFEMLLKVFTVFAKPELNQRDAEGVLQVVELVVAFARNRIYPDVTARPPNELIERLGMYFLLFDLVLSAYEILGPALRIDTWWHDFVSRFRIEYPEFNSYEPVSGRKIVIQNYILARRLQNAIRIFKQKRRPALKEIIELKRELFATRSYTFGHPRWDVWRHADKKYRARDETAKSQNQTDDHEK
ncbi:hypothetical protein ACSSS7_000759 [Eimeria intestinalis]